MTTKLRNILIVIGAVLSLVFVISKWFSSDKSTGEFVIENPKPLIVHDVDTVKKTDTVFKKVYRQENKDMVNEFEKTKDSLRRAEMYRDAIALRQYKDTVADDDIEIELNTQTRGELLSNEIGYKILKQKDSGIYFGLGTGIIKDKPYASAGLSYKSGNSIYSLDVTNNKDVLFTYKFKLAQW